MKKSNRYHFNDIKSYNADVNIAMIERTGGKTFEIKLMIMSDYLEKGIQSAFARRTKEMLDEVIFSFLFDVTQVYSDRKEKLIELDKETEKFYRKIGDKIFNFKMIGRRLYYGEDVVCFFVPLNSADNVKGLSSKRCIRLYVDEMCPETGRYLKDEWKKFSSVVSTMLRDKSNCKIYMASNALSFVNPYFANFKIKAPLENQRFVKSIISFIDEETSETYRLVIVVDFGSLSNEFKQKARKSLSGMISQLSDYGQSSLENKFIMDDHTNVYSRKQIQCKLIPAYDLTFNKIRMGVYDSNQNFIFVGNPVPIKKYNYVFEDLEEVIKEDNAIHITKRHVLCQSLLKNYVNGLIVFNDINVKQNFIEFLKNI